MAFFSLLLGMALFGCSVAAAQANGGLSGTSTVVQNSVTGTVTAVTALDTADLFSDRDLEQTADLSEAEYVRLKSNSDVIISAAGVYVLSGDVQNVTVTVEADDEAKVQLVLDGVSIINQDAPAIYVISADKVFVTTTRSDNRLEVTGAFGSDGDTNYDAAIYSREDLVLNGVGTISIVSDQGNGITSKDDLKVTGGTYLIDSQEDGIEANDSIRIHDGDITINSAKDGLHSEYDEDDSVGYVYIAGGSLDITAADDGILGTTIVQIDGGTININRSTEGIEATYIQINGGAIDIYATDDGINASRKSRSYSMLIEVNGGNMSVEVGPGDTDAFDSNGNIIVNGGVIDVTAASAFDADGTRTFNGGTVTVNGSVVTQLTGGMPGPGGGPTGGRPRH